MAIKTLSNSNRNHDLEILRHLKTDSDALVKVDFEFGLRTRILKTGRPLKLHYSFSIQIPNVNTWLKFYGVKGTDTLRRLCVFPSCGRAFCCVTIIGLFSVSRKRKKHMRPRCLPVYVLLKIMTSQIFTKIGTEVFTTDGQKTPYLINVFCLHLNRRNV
jgi:hypothetical protein